MVGPEQARVNFAVLTVALMGRDPLEGRDASGGKVFLKFEHGDDEAALLERRGVEKLRLRWFGSMGSRPQQGRSCCCASKADSQREKTSVANVFEGSGNAECSAWKSKCGIPVVCRFALGCRDQDAVEHLGPQQVGNRLGPFQTAESGK